MFISLGLIAYYVTKNVGIGEQTPRAINNNSGDSPLSNVPKVPPCQKKVQKDPKSLSQFPLILPSLGRDLYMIMFVQFSKNL